MVSVRVAGASTYAPDSRHLFLGTNTVDAFEESQWIDRSLYKFRRFYYHALRNQKHAGKEVSSDKAADEAMWNTRTEMLPTIRQDETFADDFERNEVWDKCVLALMSFKRMMMDVPIATDKVGPMHPPLASDLNKNPPDMEDGNAS